MDYEEKRLVMVVVSEQTHPRIKRHKGIPLCTGESRTPNTDHSVAAALRELSLCLARLADTLDLADHTGKHNQRTDH